MRLDAELASLLEEFLDYADNATQAHADDINREQADKIYKFVLDLMWDGAKPGDD